MKAQTRPPIDLPEPDDSPDLRYELPPLYRARIAELAVTALMRRSCVAPPPSVTELLHRLWNDIQADRPLLAALAGESACAVIADTLAAVYGEGTCTDLEAEAC